MGNENIREEIKDAFLGIIDKGKEFFEEKIEKIKELRNKIKKDEIHYDFSAPDDISIPNYNNLSNIENMNNGINLKLNSNFKIPFKNMNMNNNFHHFRSKSFNNNNFNANLSFDLEISNNNIFNNLNLNLQQANQPGHLRGLVNIANTCYMNSIIQCFAHITELFEYFRKPKIIGLNNKAFNRKYKLFPVFSELIISLWATYDTSPLYPFIFKERLGQMNQLFAGSIPNDAKDLLTFVLMQLHEELNNPKIFFNIHYQNFSPNTQSQMNKNLMLKYFSNYFKSNYRSIISELFYGLNFNVTQCTYCGTTLYNYQTYNFLIFPLIEVLNFKMKLVNYQTLFNNLVTLDDCFKHSQMKVPLNNYFCSICNKNRLGKYASFLSVLPNILIIILNRGSGLQFKQQKVKIDFEENINLKDYVEFLKENSFYELIGVVTHYGESGIKGHFVARCKSPIDGFWYLYNDAMVDKIGYFTKEKFLQGNPYILFYKRLIIQN